MSRQQRPPVRAAFAASHSLLGLSLLNGGVFERRRYFKLITPNVPARLLYGPAAKKSWLVCAAIGRFHRRTQSPRVGR